MVLVDRMAVADTARCYRRYGVVVTTVVLIVVLRLVTRNRSEGRDSDQHELDPKAFRELVNRPDVYTLDVHVPEQRHVDGTDAFIPYDSIRDHRNLLPDEDTPIALYCRSDGMSREVTAVLSELGYEEIHLLRGGIQAWNERDLPLSEHRFGEPGVRTDSLESDSHTDPDDEDDP